MDLLLLSNVKVPNEESSSCQCHGAVSYIIRLESLMHLQCKGCILLLQFVDFLVFRFLLGRVYLFHYFI